MPQTKGNFKITRFSNRLEEVLLRYRDGNSYLSKYPYEAGNLYLCAAPLDFKYNDLAKDPEVFVPMLYKMAIVTGKEIRIAYVIGKDDVIESDNKKKGAETVYKIKGNKEEFIPGQKALGPKVLLSINNQIKKAGFYTLFLQEKDIVSKYAFNYDRRESALDYYTDEELEALGGSLVDVIKTNTDTNFKQLIGERNRGIILWKWCLILALAFLLFEVLLLRFWKT